jgi:hypothetical protein
MRDNRAILARGRLKHSWLENEVLNKDPNFVVLLRREAGWPELNRFPAEAARAAALAAEVEEGFSPTTLVDTCAPLRLLPSPVFHALRDSIHAAYLHAFDAASATRRLTGAASRMESCLNSFLTEWNRSDEEVSEDAVRAGWVAVLEAALELRAALDGLPKGTVLP